MTRPKLDPAKDLREPVAFAKWPFFALRHGRRDDYEFDQWGGSAKRIWLKRMSDGDAGSNHATLADSDIMIWITSVLTAVMNAGKELPTTLEFKPGDILRALGHDTGGRRRKLLEQSLQRLAQTRIATYIDATSWDGEFHFIEDLQPGIGPAALWHLTVPEWLRSQVQQHRIATLRPDALRLHGLKRRLHGWGRAHSRSDRGAWSIPFHAAYKKAGACGPLRQFIFELKRLITADDLPGFQLSSVPDGAYDRLVIRPRWPAEQPQHARDADCAKSAETIEDPALCLAGFEDLFEAKQSQHEQPLEVILSDAECVAASPTPKSPGPPSAPAALQSEHSVIHRTYADFIILAAFGRSGIATTFI